jgi:hypothetical protein
MPIVSKKSVKDRLSNVHERLRLALAADDWPAVGVADEEVRQLLLELAQAPIPAELKDVLQRLQALHGEALKACQAQVIGLRENLLVHLQYAEGLSAYRQVTDWQENH